MNLWGIGLIVLLLGVCLVIAAPIGKKKNKRCSATTRGKMIDKWEADLSVDTSHGGAEFSYSVDGIEYKIKSTVIGKEAKNIGDTCTIWYDPKNPKKAQPFHVESTTYLTVLTIVGAIMIPVGFVLMAALA